MRINLHVFDHKITNGNIYTGRKSLNRLIYFVLFQEIEIVRVMLSEIGIGARSEEEELA